MYRLRRAVYCSLQRALTANKKLSYRRYSARRRSLRRSRSCVLRKQILCLAASVRVHAHVCVCVCIRAKTEKLLGIAVNQWSNKTWWYLTSTLTHRLRKVFESGDQTGVKNWRRRPCSGVGTEGGRLLPQWEFWGFAPGKFLEILCAKWRILGRIGLCFNYKQTAF